MKIINDKQGWFILGILLFFITLSMFIINYNFIQQLDGLGQAKFGIPIALGLFSGAWLISSFLETPTKEVQER